MRTFTLSVLLIATLAIASEARKCGPGLDRCPDSQCCGPQNTCGTGKDFCRVGCQGTFGRCLVPARPDNYGGRPAKVITTCTVPGTVALTFDDGPWTTTKTLLDKLDRHRDVKVTFFINGVNYVDGRLKEWQDVIRRAHKAGHQIGSHTFKHKDLIPLQAERIRKQMRKNDRVIYSAIGKMPRYMRPPYGNVDQLALDVLGRQDYVVVQWDVDTEDWEHKDANKSFKAYEAVLNNGYTRPFISLQHGTVESTVNELVDRVIPAIRQRGLKMVTVAECLGDSRPYL